MPDWSETEKWQSAIRKEWPETRKEWSETRKKVKNNGVAGGRL